jgi:hypothetical protein
MFDAWVTREVTIRDTMKNYYLDAFTYETEDENAVGRSGITFTIGPGWQSDTGGR